MLMTLIWHWGLKLPSSTVASQVYLSIHQGPRAKIFFLFVYDIENHLFGATRQMTKSHKLGQKKVKLGNEKQSELHNRIKAAKGGSYESSETVSQLSKQK